MSMIEWTEKTWNPIPNFSGYYASKDGNILSKRGNNKPHVLKPMMNKDRRCYVIISDDEGVRRKMYVHRLVLMAWVGMPKNTQECRHLNDIPYDNRLDNLTWGTHIENMDDKRRNGGMRYGQSVTKHKLTERDVIELRKRYAMGSSSRELAKEYGVAHNTVLNIVRGKKWKHLPTFPVIVKQKSGQKSPHSEKQREIARQNIRKAIEARKVHRVYKSVPCACGCGGMIESPDRRGRERKYIKGHKRKRYGKD